MSTPMSHHIETIQLRSSRLELPQSYDFKRDPGTDPFFELFKLFEHTFFHKTLVVAASVN